MLELIGRDLSPNGITRTYYAEGDTLHIKSECDVSSIIKNNKELNNTPGYGYNSDRSMKEIADIPMIIIEKWWREYGVNPLAPENAGLLKRLLSDPQYKFLRTGS